MAAEEVVVHQVFGRVEQVVLDHDLEAAAKSLRFRFSYLRSKEV